jgi:hypothetical protein
MKYLTALTTRLCCAAAIVTGTPALSSLGVRPSNRCDSHVTSCCASISSVTVVGDGPVGVRRMPELDEQCRLAITRRGDTA